ncbi:MAG TPA: DUF1801 domain-containing protein, partial [Gemmataceae bacterium]|nr:DUF1801 domain-containing protein [Gemmataceae bacterium]
MCRLSNTVRVVIADLLWIVATVLSDGVADGIDEYLAALDDTKRTTLETLRRTILELVPDAEETMSYGMPAFKLDGKAVAGFAAFKRHLSYVPHSGSVLTANRRRRRRLRNLQGRAALCGGPPTAEVSGEEVDRRPPARARPRRLNPQVRAGVVSRDPYRAKEAAWREGGPALVSRGKR